MQAKLPLYLDLSRAQPIVDFDINVRMRRQLAALLVSRVDVAMSVCTDMCVRNDRRRVRVHRTTSRTDQLLRRVDADRRSLQKMGTINRKVKQNTFNCRAQYTWEYVELLCSGCYIADLVLKASIRYQFDCKIEHLQITYICIWNHRIAHQTVRILIC